MADSPTPRPPRRHTIRDLRAGQVGAAASPPGRGAGPGAAGGAPSPPTSAVPDRAALATELAATLAEAGKGLGVFVFRLRVAARPLHRWADATASGFAMSAATDRAVDEALSKGLGEVVTWRAGPGDLLGFHRRPEPPDVVERLGGRLMTCLASPLGRPGREFILSVRLGVNVVDAGGEPDAEAALDAATRTVEHTVFDTPFLVHNRYIDERVRRRAEIAAALPAALSSGAVKAVFQPRVDLAEDRPVGLEVLARWSDPRRGAIPPSDFLPAAEQSGQLVDLGRCVASVAAGHARAWAQPPTLWLNVAPLELTAPDLPAALVELRAGCEGLTIGLEMADSRLLDDISFLRILDRLHGAGVPLALDNVRAGSLSLDRIKRLPLAMVNIAGDLVRALPESPGARELVRVVSTHAAEGGSLVTACGVETEEQRRVVELMGLDLVQGTGIAPPMTPDRVARYLASDRPVG